MVLFADRYDAGRRLAAALVDQRLDDPVLLALPRGGVPVAHEVHLLVGGTLDVLVVRKLGVPWQPELGIGALAEGGEPEWDLPAVRQLGLDTDELAELVARESAELERRRELYRGGPLPPLVGRTVVVIDDGLARGVTARAALRRVEEAEPARLLLAVPVGAPDTVRSLEAECDAVVCLAQPAGLGSVGEHYADFGETSDIEVLTLLHHTGKDALS